MKRVFPWVAGCAAVLGLVTVLNGYPLVFTDSGTYVRQAIRLEGAVDRPPFYSLFLLALHWRVSLWAVPFVQDFLVCAVVFRAVGIGFPGLGPGRVALGLVVTAGLSSLPWFSNQIMPDVFTPLIVLVVFCLCVGWRRMGRVERLAMGVGLGAMVSFHTANPAFAGMVLGGVVVLGVLGGERWLPMARGVAVVILMVVGAVGVQTAYGYLLIGRVTPSPSGPLFALSRLLDDGPARRYLADTCPGAGHVLCRYQGSIPDHVGFLFSSDSPLVEMYRELGFVGAVDEGEAIVAGTLRRYPGDVVRHAVGNGLEQLVTAGTVIVDCPCLGKKIDAVVREYFPREHGAFAGSLQNRELLPWAALTWVDGVALVGAWGFLGWVAVFRRGWVRGRAGVLVGVVVWGYVANAGLMGVLAGATERYGARYAWLLPLLAVVVGLSRGRDGVGGGSELDA